MPVRLYWAISAYLFRGFPLDSDSSKIEGGRVSGWGFSGYSYYKVGIDGIYGNGT